MSYRYQIVHISDLHFGPQYLPEVGDLLITEIERIQPDIVVVSGDLTLWSKASEYRASAAWLNRIQFPKLIVPGNHDVNWFNIYDQLVNRQRLFLHYVGQQNCRVFRRKGLTIVGVDSTKSFSIATGKISKRELDWLQVQLRNTPPHHFVIVVFHHHLLPIPNTGVDLYILKNGKKVLKLLQDYRVDMVLSGHRHATYLDTVMNVWPDRESEHRLIVANCGTSTSSRYRSEKQNSFNLIQLSSEQVEVQQWLHRPEQARFQLDRRFPFPNLKHALTDDPFVPAFTMKVRRS